MEENVRYFLNDDYPADDVTAYTLKRMADVDGVIKPVVALPDLHFKGSYHTPTGVVVLTKDKIIPKFLNANCGMSFVVTTLTVDDIDNGKIDCLFNALKRHISVALRLSPVITRYDLGKIIETGAEWSFRRFGLDESNLQNMENCGNIFKGKNIDPNDIDASLPDFIKDVGMLSMGVLGYGNHFVEMQAVDSVMDAEAAKMFDLPTGRICFMIHGDSRGFGQSVIDHYSKYSKKLLGLQQAYKRVYYSMLANRNIPSGIKICMDRLNVNLNRYKSVVFSGKGAKIKRSVEYRSMDLSSTDGRRYMTSNYCALNLGYANRAYIAGTIAGSLREIFKDKKMNVTILNDGNHDSLQEENIDGKNFLVHRNGAARALPPAYFNDHPIFARTGQPVLLPTALGRDSYLCAARVGCKDSCYSACHGTGRLVDRGEARGVFTDDDVYRETEAKRMRVFDYGKGKISEEAPAAFKDAKKILETMERYNIACPVVKLRPVAVLKGWR